MNCSFYKLIPLFLFFHCAAISPVPIKSASLQSTLRLIESPALSASKMEHGPTYTSAVQLMHFAEQLEVSGDLPSAVLVGERSAVKFQQAFSTSISKRFERYNQSLEEEIKSLRKSDIAWTEEKNTLEREIAKLENLIFKSEKEQTKAR